MKIVKSYGAKTHAVISEERRKGGRYAMNCACGYIGDYLNYNNKIMVSEGDPTCKKCLSKIKKGGPNE